jgi:hypothetical protein
MDILDWAEREIINWMQKAGQDKRTIQCLGLAKALLYAGMATLKTQGCIEAMVPHGEGVTEAAALYGSVGFRPTYKIYRYSKEILPDSSNVE